MRRQRTIAFILLAWLAAAPAAFASEVVDCLVTVVNGKPVTLVDCLVVLEFGLDDIRPGVAPGARKLAAAWTVVDRRLALQASRLQLADMKTEAGIALTALMDKMGPERFRAALDMFGFGERDLMPYLEEKLALDKAAAIRFGRAALISKSDVERYYRQIYVPEKKAQGLEPEPLARAEKEITERLLQENRKKQLGEWLAGLREQAGIVLNTDCLR